MKLNVESRGARLIMNNTVKHLTKGDVEIVDLLNPGENHSVIERSLRSLGFLVVSNHGVDLELLDHCYSLSEKFFALPLQEKSQLDYRQRDQKDYSNVGYFQMKTETAKGSELPDAKEFLHIGPCVDSTDELYAENVWPTPLPEFRTAFTSLYQQLQQCGDTLMKMIAKTYSLDTSFVADLVKDGNSLLRSIHYPPVEADEKALRAAPHTGIQLLGLQPRTTHPGLQFCLPSGEWVALNHEFKDYLAINIGEMLAYLLSDAVKPTLHKVVNTQNNAHKSHRYCIVHFYHANPTKFLHPIDSSQPPIQVGQWLKSRFVELGYQI